MDVLRFLFRFSMKCLLALVSQTASAQAPVDPEEPVERFRKSFYQGAEVSGGGLFDLGGGDGRLDQAFLDARVGMGLPLLSLDNILGIQPFIRVTSLDGPSNVDVPDTLYDTGVTFFHRRQVNERWSTTTLVSPAVRSDWTTDNDALRIFGLGLVNWQASPAWRWSAGVLFLDRADVNVLPAFGFVYQPNPRWRLDGTLPNPRIAHRLWKEGGQGEGWASIGGGFGGNTWATTRENGTTDLLTIRDFRLLADYETIRPGNRGWNVSLGYVFGRSLEYENDSFELDLGDALFVEASVRF